MSSDSLNIILFGETGVGKSSVINLIAGGPVADVSPDADGCTMNSKDYQFTIGSRKITIWDTVGLEEPQMGVNGYYAAVVKAYNLIQKLSRAGGVDLLLFCIRGNRITATTQSNYRLFYEVLCNKQVPIALIITHLEREHRMEEWWTRNEGSILKYGIKCAGHACVTGITDKAEKFRESRDAISTLLSQHDNRGRFTMPQDPWFIRLLEHLASLVSPNSSVGKDISRNLIKRCGLDVETAQRLAGQLRGSGDRQ
ncbi:P-loop containing nucleoside triphosphate hydrolase protein [Pisolithus thermaeus]|nr:P-loop containing nucleoside triphosphate hydrolase protein [Pisolithus thermaeus]